MLQQTHRLEMTHRFAVQRFCPWSPLQRKLTKTWHIADTLTHTRSIQNKVVAWRRSMTEEYVCTPPGVSVQTYGATPSLIYRHCSFLSRRLVLSHTNATCASQRAPSPRFPCPIGRHNVPKYPHNGGAVISISESKSEERTRCNEVWSSAMTKLLNIHQSISVFCSWVVLEEAHFVISKLRPPNPLPFLCFHIEH